jgi:hypothetical protein
MKHPKLGGYRAPREVFPSRADRYELEQAGAVGPVGGRAQKEIKVLSDDPVEHTRFGVARLMASPGTAHAPA